MNIVVFGASGRTGLLFVQQALAAGHTVVAFARTPSKIGLAHDRLRVVAGDLGNREQVRQAVAGAGAVVSLLGPVKGAPPFTVSKGVENILAAMKAAGVRRLVVSAGAGVGDPNDKPGLPDRLITGLLKRVARDAYEDMKRVVDLVRASDREWTVVRAPMLTDLPHTGNIRAGYLGHGVGMRLSRADMADFMLRQLTDTAQMRKAPVISN